MASLTPGQHDFGPQLVGTSSEPVTFTVTNSGTGDLHVGTAALDGPDAGQYLVPVDGDHCSGQTVSPGASCSVDVLFEPVIAGTTSATLVIASDDAASPATATLSGTGSQPAANLSPNQHAFGQTLIGTTTDAFTFTITNTGSADLHLGTAGLAGTSPGQYAIPSTQTTARARRSRRAPAAASMSSLRPPNAASSRPPWSSAPDDPATPAKATLSGSGIQPVASLTPDKLQFGQQVIGTTSNPATFTITNTGNADLHVGHGRPRRSAANQFSIPTDADHCSSQTLAPAATCTVDVVFSPTATGKQQASLSIPSDDAASPATAALVGTGTQPAAGLTPDQRDFGSQLVGTSSDPVTFTVTNAGTADLHVGTAALNGADADQFSVPTTGDHCSGQTVTPGSRCSLDVVFAPTTPGTKQATLLIASDDPASPATATLAGTSEIPPTASPTEVPPTEAPTPSEVPTIIPTEPPTLPPTEAPTPTEIPTVAPTEIPTRRSNRATDPRADSFTDAFTHTESYAVTDAGPAARGKPGS